MRWALQLVVALGLFLGSSNAGTYYIDFASGSDSNSGNLTDAAWKRHPYMKGFSGSYSHSTGDRFIFKGGVTWGSSCFQMQIQASGTSGNPDYYGVDTN